MGRWMKVIRCKKCGKIFKRGAVPEICPKCGTCLVTSGWLSRIILGPGKKTPDPDKCELIIARRRLFGWQISHPEEKATQSDQVSGNDPQQNTEGTV